jgi:hypothetical protein
MRNFKIIMAEDCSFIFIFCSPKISLNKFDTLTRKCFNQELDVLQGSCDIKLMLGRLRRTIMETAVMRGFFDRPFPTPQPSKRQLMQ